MEDLNNISSTHELESFTANPHTQFVVPNTKNLSESTTMNMDIENSNASSSKGGRSAQIAIAIKPDENTPPAATPNPHTAWVHNYPGIMYLIYAATLLYMFPSMLELVELKFQNKARSVFETHSVFANMAVAAYIIAITVSVALFCIKARLERSNMETLSPIYYRILQSVFYFSSILAPLSFVFVSFFPHGFDLIGYSLVVTLFMIIVACSFSNSYICKKDAPNLEPL